MTSTSSVTKDLKLRERILLAVLYAVVVAVSLLPFRVLYIISDLLYLIVCHAVGYRRKVIRKNLRRSFPEKSEAELRGIEHAFYHYFCDYIVETVKLASISRREMRRRMVFRGMEHISRAVAEGRGVALYIGHYGNWEWITSIGLHLPEGSRGCQVYHVLESRVMDRLMLRLRSKMDTDSVPMAETLRRLLKMRQQGVCPVVGFISDQSPIIYNVPYWTTFLNQETPFINGSERIARKFDYIAVYLDVRVVRRGHYEVTLLPIADHCAALPENAVTQRYAELLENNIRRQPAYWLWSYNRWKRSHADFKNEERRMMRKEA